MLSTPSPIYWATTTTWRCYAKPCWRLRASCRPMYDRSWSSSITGAYSCRSRLGPQASVSTRRDRAPSPADTVATGKLHTGSAPGSALLGLRGLRIELERARIDAVAQARGSGSVAEDVAEVPTAGPADHLGADHSVAVIGVRLDVARHGGLVEARPAAAGFELRDAHRSQPRNGPHRGDLPGLRWAPRPRLQRRTRSHGPALLHQFVRARARSADRAIRGELILARSRCAAFQ